MLLGGLVFSNHCLNPLPCFFQIAVLVGYLPAHIDESTGKSFDLFVFAHQRLLTRNAIRISQLPELFLLLLLLLANPVVLLLESGELVQHIGLSLDSSFFQLFVLGLFGLQLVL